MQPGSAKPIISIIGGTQTGLQIVNRILKRNNILDQVTVRLFEPNSQVAYSNLLPYMSVGIVSRFKGQKLISQLIPSQVEHIRELPSEIDPKNQSLTLASGEKQHYDYLILSSFGKNDYSEIKGLEKALEDIKIPVTSTHDYDSTLDHKHHLQNFKGGQLQFYIPDTSRHNLLESLSVTNLSLEYLKNKSLNFHLLFQTDIIAQRKLPQTEISQNDFLAAFADFRKTFKINEHEGLTLKEIDTEKLVALYEEKQSKKVKSYPFNLLHVTPTQVLPDVLRSLPNNGNKYLDVDKKSLQVKGFSNIWTIGYLADLGATSLLNLSNQSEVIADNVLNVITQQGRLCNREYDEKQEDKFYLGGKRIADSNSSFQDDDWAPSLNYYKHIFVDPLLY